MEQNYYELLGVPRDGTPDEIKKAYRQKAKQYHPDVAGSKYQEAEATEMFKRLNEAYEVLKNEDSRRQYDAELELEEKLRRVWKEARRREQARREEEKRQEEETRRRHEELNRMREEQVKKLGPLAKFFYKRPALMGQHLICCYGALASSAYYVVMFLIMSLTKPKAELDGIIFFSLLWASFASYWLGIRYKQIFLSIDKEYNPDSNTGCGGMIFLFLFGGGIYQLVFVLPVMLLLYALFEKG